MSAIEAGSQVGSCSPSDARSAWRKATRSAGCWWVPSPALRLCIQPAQGGTDGVARTMTASSPWLSVSAVLGGLALPRDGKLMTSAPDAGGGPDMRVRVESSKKRLPVLPAGSHAVALSGGPSAPPPAQDQNHLARQVTDRNEMAQLNGLS